jgi:hypothetical protein
VHLSDHSVVITLLDMAGIQRRTRRATENRRARKGRGGKAAAAG